MLFDLILPEFKPLLDGFDLIGALFSGGGLFRC